jgi:3-methyladenine DNA glycosylase Tag
MSMTEPSWTPQWVYRGKRPPNDDAYFENMTRVIFLAGLSWKMIDKKWPGFKDAFKGFSVETVARFSDEDVQRLISDENIVRNGAKILATINNLKKKYGSFQRYLDSLDKSENYVIVIKELRKEFSRMGHSSARIFLYSVGEDVKRPNE